MTENRDTRLQSRKPRSLRGRLQVKKQVKKHGAETVSQGLLEHLDLLQYPAKRGVRPEVARSHASHSDFKRPERAGSYLAVGCPPRDGFEAHRAIFKGFTGVGKNVTYHDKPDSRLRQAFEGLMDHLSYLTALTVDMPDGPPGAVLVLNSTDLWRRALPYLEDPRLQKVRLYRENEARCHATAQLVQSSQAGKLENMQRHYAGCEDLNDWLVDRTI